MKLSRLLVAFSVVAGVLSIHSSQGHAGGVYTCRTYSSYALDGNKVIKLTAYDNHTVRLDYLESGDFGTFTRGSRTQTSLDDITYLVWDPSIAPSRSNRNLEIIHAQTHILGSRPRVEIGITHGRLTTFGYGRRTVEYNCE